MIFISSVASSLPRTPGSNDLANSHLWTLTTAYHFSTLRDWSFVNFNKSLARLAYDRMVVFATLPHSASSISCSLPVLPSASEQVSSVRSVRPTSTYAYLTSEAQSVLHFDLWFCNSHISGNASRLIFPRTTELIIRPVDEARIRSVLGQS